MKEQSLTEKKKAMCMDRVIHTSLHYFEENGYYNTTIDTVCKEAMISRATFYNYFGTKEKIIKLIMEDGLKDFKEIIGSIDVEAEHDPVECAMKPLKLLLRAMSKYKNTTFVFYKMLTDDEECRTIQKEYDKELSGIIDQIQIKWDFKHKYSRTWIEKVIGGSFLSIVMLNPEDDWEVLTRDIIEGLITMMR